MTYTFGAAVALLLFILVAVGVRLDAQTECLAHGYPKTKITISFTRYCIKRVNQTDQVVRLADL